MIEKESRSSMARGGRKKSGGVDLVTVMSDLEKLLQPWSTELLLAYQSPRVVYGDVAPCISGLRHHAAALLLDSVAPTSSFLTTPCFPRIRPAPQQAGHAAQRMKQVVDTALRSLSSSMRPVA